METLLGKIQDTVIKYANVLAQIMKIDVEIMDERMVRIAGTGAYKDGINKSMVDEGYVYQTVLQTGERQIIREPGKHAICHACPKRLGCLEKFEICTPIKMKDKVIGVIGLICFKEEQKEYLLANFTTFLTFLEQIADFISAKAYEKKESERILITVNLLNKIVERMEQGVVILDRDNYISHMNENARKIFNVDDYRSTQLNLIPTGHSFLEQQEYKAVLGGKEYFLVGDQCAVDLNEEKYDKLFIFNETKAIKNQIYKLTNPEDTITLEDILGTSAKITSLKKRVKQIAQSTSTVLITGESGTGKEMFARAIHKESNRSQYPFVAINCGAIPDTLLESELFGYVKGAFTGADPKGKIGKFELANRGTLFLDEIGDLPLYLQVKLLRVLQERAVTRLGANQPIKIDIRIIAATNKDLEKMLREGAFREDLYYRLNVIPLEIPPLRERTEDIKVLSRHFAAKYSALFHKKLNGIEQEVWEYLLNYPWPGNIRELENTIEFMINMMDINGILSKDTLPRRILDYRQESEHYAEEAGGVLNLKAIEKQTIKRALELYGATTEGKKLAARKLGIGIATLYRKLDEYDLLK